eukprot:scaffold298_cov247-Pinguiococcus_pyrenoidosus.AAC.36
MVLLRLHVPFADGVENGRGRHVEADAHRPLIERIVLEAERRRTNGRRVEVPFQQAASHLRFPRADLNLPVPGQPEEVSDLVPHLPRLHAIDGVEVERNGALHPHRGADGLRRTAEADVLVDRGGQVREGVPLLRAGAIGLHEDLPQRRLHLHDVLDEGRPAPRLHGARHPLRLAQRVEARWAGREAVEERLSGRDVGDVRPLLHDGVEVPNRQGRLLQRADGGLGNLEVVFLRQVHEDLHCPFLQLHHVRSEQSSQDRGAVESQISVPLCHPVLEQPAAEESAEAVVELAHDRLGQIVQGGVVPEPLKLLLQLRIAEVVAAMGDLGDGADDGEVLAAHGLRQRGRRQDGRRMRSSADRHLKLGDEQLRDAAAVVSLHEAQPFRLAHQQREELAAAADVLQVLVLPLEPRELADLTVPPAEEAGQALDEFRGRRLPEPVRVVQRRLERLRDRVPVPVSPVLVDFHLAAVELILEHVLLHRQVQRHLDIVANLQVRHGALPRPRRPRDDGRHGLVRFDEAKERPDVIHLLLHVIVHRDDGLFDEGPERFVASEVLRGGLIALLGEKLQRPAGTGGGLEALLQLRREGDPLLQVLGGALRAVIGHRADRHVHVLGHGPHGITSVHRADAPGHLEDEHQQAIALLRQAAILLQSQRDEAFEEAAVQKGRDQQREIRIEQMHGCGELHPSDAGAGVAVEARVLVGDPHGRERLDHGQHGVHDGLPRQGLDAGVAEQSKERRHRLGVRRQQNEAAVGAQHHDEGVARRPPLLQLDGVHAVQVGVRAEELLQRELRPHVASRGVLVEQVEQRERDGLRHVLHAVVQNGVEEVLDAVHRRHQVRPPHGHLAEGLQPDAAQRVRLSMAQRHHSMGQRGRHELRRHLEHLPRELEALHALHQQLRRLGEAGGHQEVEALLQEGQNAAAVHQKIATHAQSGAHQRRGRLRHELRQLLHHEFRL